MPEWKELEAAIGEYLHSIAPRGTEFRNSYQAIVGFPPDGFRSDGMLTDGRCLLAVEVEAGQMHPDTNVGKYWLLHSRYRQYEKIVLIRVYTPRYESYPWRKQLGEFYVESMSSEVPIEYVQLDLRTATSYTAVLQEASEEVAAKVRQLFQ